MKGGGLFFPSLTQRPLHSTPALPFHTPPHPPNSMVHTTAGAFGAPSTVAHAHTCVDPPTFNGCPFQGGEWNRGRRCFSGFSLLLTSPQEAMKGLTLSSWACCSHQQGDPWQPSSLPPSSAELWNTFSSLTSLLVSRLPLNILLLYFTWISIIFCRSAALFLSNLSYPKCDFHPLPFFKKYIFIGV